MVSKQIALAYGLTALVSGALGAGGVLAYVGPSAIANPTSLDVRPSIATDPFINPWTGKLSEDAVDSGGIEKDLDGNASALQVQ